MGPDHDQFQIIVCNTIRKKIKANTYTPQGNADTAKAAGGILMVDQGGKNSLTQDFNKS